MTDIFDFRTSLTTYMLKLKHSYCINLDIFQSKSPLEVCDSTFSHGLVSKKTCNKSQYRITMHNESAPKYRIGR